jgi:hypothetical protein
MIWWTTRHNRVVQHSQATVEARIRDPQRYPVLPEIITPLPKKQPSTEFF